MRGKTRRAVGTMRHAGSIDGAIDPLAPTEDAEEMSSLATDVMRSSGLGSGGSTSTAKREQCGEATSEPWIRNRDMLSLVTAARRQALFDPLQ